MAVLLTLCFSAKMLEAQMIEQAESVPAGITGDELKDLEKQKSDLDNEFQEVTSSIQEYNTFCLGIQNSMNAMSCQGRHSALTGRMSTYQASLLRYRSAINKATEK
jgi:predicted  nucleic acid-binding Zn-ribbon protein